MRTFPIEGSYLSSPNLIFQNDIKRKPQGEILMDQLCRITRADGAATFEIATTKKTYYLTADSIATMEEWLRILQVKLNL